MGRPPKPKPPKPPKPPQKSTNPTADQIDWDRQYKRFREMLKEVYGR